MESNVEGDDEEDDQPGQYEVDKTPSFFSQRFAADLLRSNGENINDENYNSENIDIGDLNGDANNNYNSLINKVSLQQTDCSLNINVI